MSDLKKKQVAHLKGGERSEEAQKYYFYLEKNEENKLKVLIIYSKKICQSLNKFLKSLIRELTLDGNQFCFARSFATLQENHFICKLYNLPKTRKSCERITLTHRMKK